MIRGPPPEVAGAEDDESGIDPLTKRHRPLLTNLPHAAFLTLTANTSHPTCPICPMGPWMNTCQAEMVQHMGSQPYLLLPGTFAIGPASAAHMYLAAIPCFSSYRLRCPTYAILCTPCDDLHCSWFCQPIQRWGIKHGPMGIQETPMRPPAPYLGPYAAFLCCFTLRLTDPM